MSWLAFGFELYTPVIPEVATSNCLHVHYWRLKGPFQWTPVSITLGDVSLSTVGLSDKKFFRIENISFLVFANLFEGVFVATLHAMEIKPNSSAS